MGFLKQLFIEHFPRTECKRLGRPCKTTEAQRYEIRELLAQGKTVSEVARSFGVSRASVIVIRSTCS